MCFYKGRKIYYLDNEGPYYTESTSAAFLTLLFIGLKTTTGKRGLIILNADSNSGFWKEKRSL
jgi:hypothetical protein